MSLIKQTLVDQAYAVGNIVHVRTAMYEMEDDVVVSSSFHRHTIAPGQDYSNEDKKVQEVCATIHTPELIASLASADK